LGPCEREKILITKRSHQRYYIVDPFSQSRWNYFASDRWPHYPATSQ
jgi:hypothetical protein